MADNQTKFISKQRLLRNVCKNITRGNIDLYPAWQRNVVWNTRMQRDLITTILKGFPINPIVVWQIDDGKKEVCVDGKNRLSAIFEFINNKYTVEYEGKDIKFDELPEEVRERFEDENLDIRILTGSYWTETKVREYFQVIQGGAKLTWPEIINAFNNKFVDFMREVMINNQSRFAQILGEDCNVRFELYNIIANVFSVHPIVYRQYKSSKNKQRTADTNKSLMKYVMNFDDFNVSNEETLVLVSFLHSTIDIIDELHTMQKNEITRLNKSIWFLTETDTNTTRIKPGIRDFTSIAYYIVLNPTRSIDAISFDMKKMFKTFMRATLNPSKHHDIMSFVRDYYITYGKNQKQYAWSSVDKRYNIMINMFLNN
jgi:hypothetical protein